MTEFEFQLFCRGADSSDERFLDGLYDSGCSDATVYFKDGYVCLEFARPAASPEQAIVSAIRDLERSSTGLTVIRIEPDDLASLSEIARRVGVTRASLQKYARGDSKVGKDFPAPVQNLSLARRELFSTVEVMAWMLSKSRANIANMSLDLYRAVADINQALEIRRAEQDERIGRLVASLPAVHARRRSVQ